MQVVFAGLATMRIVQLVKEVIPFPLQPWTKSILSVLVPLALCVWLNDGYARTALIVLGAAGVSSLCHEVRDFLSSYGDQAKLGVIMRGSQRRVPL